MSSGSGKIQPYDYGKSVVAGEMIFPKTGEWGRFQWNHALSGFILFQDHSQTLAYLHIGKILFGYQTDSPSLDEDKVFLLTEGVNADSLHSHSAENISIEDTEEYFEADDVETALEELAKEKYIILTAGENISALRVITVNTDGEGIYADSSTVNHANLIAGISYTAGLEGESIKVIHQGKVKDSFFSFDMTKPIFLGSNGVLTQTPPTSGIAVIIGSPVAVDTLILRIQGSIVL